MFALLFAGQVLGGEQVLDVLPGLGRHERDASGVDRASVADEGR